MKLLDQAIPLPIHRTLPEHSWAPPPGVRIISSDDHAMEADGLFEDRLPAKFKDRAPILRNNYKTKEISFSAEGRSFLFPGLDTEIFMSLEGQYDARVRLAHMDAENISASLVFQGLFQALNGLQDRELYWACADVYNEWLLEYIKPAGKRMTGVAICPAFERPEAAHDYMQKLKDLGYRAVSMPHSPRGVRWNSKSMFPLWKAIEASGMPLSFHAGLYTFFQGNGSTGANLTANLCPYRNLFGALAFSGALELHPDLKIVFHEGGGAWVAQTLSDVDYIAATFSTQLKPKLSMRPSEYWRRQCHASFMLDPSALRLVDVIGEDNILWSSDYPHPEGTFGYTGELLKEAWETLGPVAGAKFIGGNAARLWGL